MEPGVIPCAVPGRQMLEWPIAGLPALIPNPTQRHRGSASPRRPRAPAAASAATSTPLAGSGRHH